MLAFAPPLLQGDPLLGRVVAEIYDRLQPRTGVAFIGSLGGMARTLDCARETLRRYLPVLTRKGLIIKNAGNAASMLGTRGITVALALPESLWEALNPQQSTAAPYPPISDTTGIATPDFQTQAGWNPSRSPYSHEVGGDETSSSQVPTGQDYEGKSCHPGRDLAALWHKPDRLTDDDWREAGVIHPEYGEHMDELADRWGRGAVSRLMANLEDLRTLRKSFVEIRHDAERAADIAARTLAKKIGKAAGMTEAEIAHAVREACPARVDKEDSAGFVREMARHLKAIVREAQGHPDPWGSRRWRQKQQQSDATEPKVNAYAAARHKRDSSASS